MSARGQVHRQESRIAEDVDPAKTLVEFDPIERHHATLPLEYIGQMQVTMTLPYETVMDPLLELLSVVVRESCGPMLQALQLLGKRFGTI